MVLTAESSLATSSSPSFTPTEDIIAEQEKEIEEELANVTFEELLKARSNGSEALPQSSKSSKKGGRVNKNRPMEISSKKPIGRFREVIQAQKKVVRDPRFESLCGNLDAEGFKKRYDFIYQECLPAEKEELKKKMKKSKDPEAIKELKDRIACIDKQLKSSTRSTDKDLLAEHKKRERDAAKQGKKPYYLKKSEIRKQSLIEKYNELKASGKLESFIEKRRRKNAAKDHRYMPYRRTHDKQ